MTLPILNPTAILPYIFIFLLFFAFIFFAFKKTIFAGNKAINAIASLSASALIVWALATQTDYLNFEFSAVEFSPWILAFGIIALLLLGLLISSILSRSSTLKSKGFLFAIAGLVILTGISTFIFSPYYLPEWLNKGKIPILIIGVALLIWWIRTIRKKDEGETYMVKKKT